VKPSRILLLLIPFLIVATALSWAGPAQQGGVLVVGHHLDPTTLDPFGTTTAAFQSVFAQIVEQLVVFDAERAVVRPWLATSWRWLDPTTLEMQLRRGVSFSNGEPFDAAAARYSLELLFRAAPYSAWTQDLVRSVETAGSHTVRIRLVRPSAFLLPLLARGSFVVPPRHHQEVGAARFAQQPIGTGPFVLSEWSKGARIVLDRNPRYWGGQHPLRQVIFRVIPDDSARVVALQAGEIDVALNAPITHFNRLKIDRNLKVIAAPGLRKFTSFFNTRLDTPIRDRRVRIAMNLAVDGQSIVRRVFGGQAQVLPGHWLLPQEFGYDPNLKPFPFDPARARQLLAEAGFPNGFETQLTYTVGRYPLDKELGEIVAGYLEAIGVRVRQRPVEYGEFLRLRSAGQLGPIHQWGLLVPPDAHFSYSLFTKGSIYRFHDYPDEWDRLIDQAASELDSRRREAIYRRLAVLSHEDPFGIYLIAPGNLYAMRATVRGLTPRFDEVLWLYDVAK
jgi:peptide/nickel transport system substrate-binding protein